MREKPLLRRLELVYRISIRILIVDASINILSLHLPVKLWHTLPIVSIQWAFKMLILFSFKSVTFLPHRLINLIRSWLFRAVEQPHHDMSNFFKNLHLKDQRENGSCNVSFTTEKKQTKNYLLLNVSNKFELTRFQYGRKLISV